MNSKKDKKRLKYRLLFESMTDILTLILKKERNEKKLKKQKNGKKRRFQTATQVLEKRLETMHSSDLNFKSEEGETCTGQGESGESGESNNVQSTNEHTKDEPYAGTSEKIIVISDSEDKFTNENTVRTRTKEKNGVRKRLNVTNSSRKRNGRKKEDHIAKRISKSNITKRNKRTSTTETSARQSSKLKQKIRRRNSKPYKKAKKSHESSLLIKKTTKKKHSKIMEQLKSKRKQLKQNAFQFIVENLEPIESTTVLDDKCQQSKLRVNFRPTPLLPTKTNDTFHFGEFLVNSIEKEPIYNHSTPAEKDEIQVNVENQSPANDETLVNGGTLVNCVALVNGETLRNGVTFVNVGMLTNRGIPVENSDYQSASDGNDLTIISDERPSCSDQCSSFAYVPDVSDISADEDQPKTNFATEKSTDEMIFNSNYVEMKTEKISLPSLSPKTHKKNFNGNVQSTPVFTSAEKQRSYRRSSTINMQEKHSHRFSEFGVRIRSEESNEENEIRQPREYPQSTDNGMRNRGTRHNYGQNEIKIQKEGTYQRYDKYSQSDDHETYYLYQHDEPYSQSECNEIPNGGTHHRYRDSYSPMEGIQNEGSREHGRNSQVDDDALDGHLSLDSCDTNTPLLFEVAPHKAIKYPSLQPDLEAVFPVKVPNSPEAIEISEYSYRQSAVNAKHPTPEPTLNIGDFVLKLTSMQTPLTTKEPKLFTESDSGSMGSDDACLKSDNGTLDSLAELYASSTPSNKSFAKKNDDPTDAINAPREESHDARTDSYGVTEQSHDMIKKNKFYKSMTSNQVFLLLRNKTYFHGALNVRLLLGSASIFGYTLSIHEEVTAHSLTGQSFLYLAPESNHNVESKENVNLALNALWDCCSDSDSLLQQIISDFNGSTDAIVILERDTSNNGVIMIEKYMENYILPNINASDEPSEYHHSEMVLHCQFSQDPQNGLKINPQWEDIVMSSNSRHMIIGGKGVGKSTLFRYLINKNLKEFQKILLIDLDIDQPEIFLPQTISATILSKPLLGPGYLKDTSPQKSYFFDDTNVLVSTSKYFKCVLKLFEYCRKEFPSMPWIVNTGDYQALELELTSAIIRALNPTDLIQIQSHESNIENILTTEVINNRSLNILMDKEQAPQKCSYTLNLIDTVSSTDKTNLYDKSILSLQLATILSRLANRLPWNATLTNVNPPVYAHLEDLKILMNDDFVTARLYSTLINGSFCYLCKTLEDDGEFAECYGIALVRGVNVVTNKVYILPSVAKVDLVKVNTLAVCSIPIPSCILTDYCHRNAVDVPYMYRDETILSSPDR